MFAPIVLWINYTIHLFPTTSFALGVTLAGAAVTLVLYTLLWAICHHPYRTLGFFMACALAVDLLRGVP